MIKNSKLNHLQIVSFKNLIGSMTIYQILQYVKRDASINNT
jgi:hypothetical protein